MKVFLYLLNLLFPLRESQIVVNSITPGELVRKMRVGRDVHTGIIHLLPYRDSKVRACIYEAKFHNNTTARAHVAEVLLKYMSRMPSPYLIVPIPLSPKRRRARGYNQVEEILTSAHLPFSPVLVRTRDTSPQTLIPKEQRYANMQGAFTCPSQLSSIPIYILLDDVTTTGSTLKAAERALKQAGAQKILLVSLAH